MAQPPVMLIVDDDPGILRLIERFAVKQSLLVVTKSSGREALDYLLSHAVDIALVDVKMPDVNGLQVLKGLRETAPDCRVVLMTGAPDMAVAVEAIKYGAEDVLAKPMDLDRLAQLLDGLQEENSRRQRARDTDRQRVAQVDFHGMVGQSAAMETLFSLIRRLAPHVRAAVITGETGTGKELVARALHARGPRAARSLITLNCAAIVPTLVESELFGHTRGAFTGANDHKAGVFELADRGTLFLDEIGELPLDIQSKLLRVLEGGETKRVGANDTRTVDVHVIAATNRDLGAEVAAGRFRSDLYYRLQVIELRVPPLRERREDIPMLVATFIREFGHAFGRAIAGAGHDVEAILLARDWPGNVRQLRNVIERACLLVDGEWITPAEVADTAKSIAAPARMTPVKGLSKSAVATALAFCSGNKTHAATKLGVSRRALYRLIANYGLGNASHRPARL